MKSGQSSMTSVSSPFAFIFTALLQISEAHAIPINVNVSALTNTQTLSEVSIDINPTNLQNMVIISHDRSLRQMDTFYSTDGGAGWATVPVGAALDGKSASATRFDPSIAFDAKGTVYIAYGVTDSTSTAVVVARSSDGGKTYSTTVVAQNPNLASLISNDKWHLATGPDPTDPSKQNVYIAWTKNTVGEQQIVLAVSKDGGSTFSAPVKVNDKFVTGNLFAEPAVGKDGKVYVSWHDINSRRVFLDVSSDAGATFGTDKLVSTTSTGFSGFMVPIRPDPQRGVFVGPTIETDRSSGKYKGRIYEAYMDLVGDYTFGSKENTDIFVRHSDDDGTTWSTPVRVNDDVGSNSQFLPWMDVDPTTGILGLVWYDARNDPNNTLVDVYGAFSLDGGVTFGKNILLSASSSAPSLYPGDYLEYIGLASLGGTSCAAWSKSVPRNTKLDIITTCVKEPSKIDLPEPGTLALLALGIAGLGGLQRRRRVSPPGCCSPANGAR